MDVDVAEPNADATPVEDPAGAGEPGSELSTPPLPKLFGYGITGSSRRRLEEALRCEFVEDLGDGDPDLIVISTRIPLGEVSGALAYFRRIPHVPFVAVVHAGGEDLATELLRAGGAGLVAEGKEPAVAAYLGRSWADGSLLETYDQRLGRTRLSEIGPPRRDPVTGLPTRGDFDGALTEAAQAGQMPRVGAMRMLHYDSASRRLSTEAIDLLRRRLTAQWREIARLFGAELYVYSPVEFGWLAVGQSSEEASAMGRMLAQAAEAFAPAGGRNLGLAVGHAGPEVTTEIAALRELAQRAVELASTGAESLVLSADDLSRTLASTTELEVLLRMVRSVERQRAFAPADEPAAAAPRADVKGRGLRVAEEAARMAQRLGFEGVQRSQIRLAGHTHEIGKISLPARSIAAPQRLDGDALAAYQRYPQLGAEYLRVTAGREVALAVRHHQERWDGSGYPDGLSAEDIPVGARIVAVALEVVELGLDQADADERPALLRSLREGRGARFDPTVVAAVEAEYEQQPPSLAGQPPEPASDGGSSVPAPTY